MLCLFGLVWAESAGETKKKRGRAVPGLRAYVAYYGLVKRRLLG